MHYYPEAESNLVELKRELPKNDSIIKTVIGFCNSYGGKIVIGVANDRSIVGLTDKEIEYTMEAIDKSIFDACSPHIVPRLYIQQFHGKSVLVIEIHEGMNKPYYRQTEGLEKGVYLRLGRHTLRANNDMIQELKWQSRGIDFERLPVFQATLEDLDMEAIKHFLGNRKNVGAIKLDETILKSYAIIAFDQLRKYPSVLGLLLFGKNPQVYFSEAMIICSHIKGTSGREILATIDCEGNIFNQFNQAFAFITSRLYRSFKINHLKRKEQLEIPEVAIREALLNMVVHRNYHIKAPSKIAIFDDRIEFFNPGQFPGPIITENLRAGISYLRNPALCKILREAKYIEKLGSGFITIFKSYEEQNLKTPQVIEGENYVKCILPRVKETKLNNLEYDNDLVIIKNLFQVTAEINVKDVMQKLTVSRATAIRKLNALLKKGLIERIGKTKNVRYRLIV